MGAIDWHGSHDGGALTAFGPKGGGGGSWRLGSVVRYHHSFSNEPPFWRAFLVSDRLGDFPTADEAMAAVEAAVEAEGE